VIVYAFTVFFSAFLLFAVEPLIGKYILPEYGGTPAVWTSCLVFFQIGLLAGYAYAHGLADRLRPRTQLAIHLTLLGASLAALGLLSLGRPAPILTRLPSRGPPAGTPILEILGLLAAAVGFPYFLLATTGPLLQGWFERSYREASPYRLYALSNLGSLLALLSYPFLVEPTLTLRKQAWVWSIAYAVFAPGCAICGVVFARRSNDEEAFAPAEDPVPRPGAAIALFWAALAAVASALLLATTNQISQDVAAIPFLWILPLAIYLLSFVFCFHSERLYSRGFFGYALIAAIAASSFALYRGVYLGVILQIVIYAASLLICCMVCHGELYRSRPHPRHLTLFYLMVALGGALGGLFVVVAAPRIFRAFGEFHLGLWSCAALALVAAARDPSSWLRRGTLLPGWIALTISVGLALELPPVLRPQMTDLMPSAGIVAAVLGVVFVLTVLRARRSPPGGVARRFAALAAILGALGLLGGILVFHAREYLRDTLVVKRNFYGILAVVDENPQNPKEHRLLLRHGRIVHGLQYRTAELRTKPTSYYGPESGIGLAILHHPRRTSGRPMRIGVVGLGTGTISAYGRRGDLIRFYEINPAVIALSTGRVRHFTYASDSPARVEIVPGDARISLTRELARGDPQNYDVLAIDAFSSDAIPVHLLTREAFAVYLANLRPGAGILAVHISNRYLDLKPVVLALARSGHLAAAVIDSGAQDDVIWKSTWVLVSRNAALLRIAPIAKAAASTPAVGHSVTPWTDDYSNLFETLKW
jgi:hypothetical protein